MTADKLFLYRLLAKQELQKTADHVTEIKQSITKLYNSDAVDGSLPWDVLVPQPVHTMNRYDIFPWTLMANNQTFLQYEYDINKPMKGKLDSNPLVPWPLGRTNIPSLCSGTP